MCAKVRMGELLDELDWDSLSLDDKCSKLKSILVEANVDSYRASPCQLKKPRKDCKVKKLRAAYKLADRKEKLLSLHKVKHFLASDVWSLADQEELEQSVNDNLSLLGTLNKRVLELGLRKQQHLHVTICISNKPFRCMYRNIVKHKGGPLSLKGWRGRIVTRKDELADLALAGMALAFMGQCSPPFV